MTCQKSYSLIYKTLTASTFKTQTKITARCKECVVDCDQPFSFGWTEPGQLRVEESGEPRKSKFQLPTSTNMQFSLIPHVAEPAFHACVISKQDMQDGMSSAVHIWADRISLSIKEAVRELGIFSQVLVALSKSAHACQAVEGYHFDCEESTFHARTTQINTWKVRQLELKGGYECRRSNT